MISQELLLKNNNIVNGKKFPAEMVQFISVSDHVLPKATFGTSHDFDERSLGFLEAK
jgi:hypothetical protein